MRPALAPSALVVGALLAGVCAGALTGCPQKPGGQDAGPVASALPSGSTSAAPFVLPTVAWDEGARTAAITAGQAVLRKHQCARCHAIDAIEAPARPLHCTSCHIFLKGLEPGKDEWVKIEKKYGKGILERYGKNIEHLEQVPSLTNLGQRVRADWIMAFLAEPYDLRPLLGESMIRHALSADEIKVLGRYFAAVAKAQDPTAGSPAPALPPKPDDARLEKGKQLFAQRGCASCHTFGNVDFGVTATQLAASKVVALLAPNLRFVRERTRPDVLVQWIVDPKSVSPTTTMPALGVTVADAEILRDYLLYGDPKLGPAPAPPSLEPPKLLDRPVSYEEMKENVLGKICVHCHMNDYEKDPGPGNLGGLGFTGVHLQMRTYEMLVSGYVDAKGKRVSALVPREGEKLAPIVTAMLRRRLEAPRDQVAPFADHAFPPYPKDGLSGMPLGLPTMSDEQIALLATWISQGCKGPKAVAGQAGVYDGYLVPDGPIEKNDGCEVRPPSKKRPAWTVETEKAAAAGAASVKPSPSALPQPSAGPPAK